MGESLWRRKTAKRICEVSAKLSRIHEYRGLWLSWLRLSDSRSIGHFCDKPRPSGIQKKKKIHLFGSRAFPKFSEKAPRWGSKHFERLSSWFRRHLSSLNRERKRKSNLSRCVSMTNAKNIWRYGWYFLFFRTIGKLQSSFISQEYHKEEEIYNCIWKQKQTEVIMS